MDVLSRRILHRKLSYMVAWPLDKDDGHLMPPNAVAEVDADTTVTGGRDTTVRLWHGEANIRTITHNTDAVNDVCVVNGNEPHALTCSNDFRVSLINLQSGEVQDVAGRHHSDSVKRVRAQGSHFFSTGLDGFIFCTDAACLHEPFYSAQAPDPIFSMDVHRTKIALGGMRGGLFIMDTRQAPSSSGHSSSSSAALKSPHGITPLTPVVASAHAGTVRDIRFVDEHKLVSGGSDGVVRLWDTRNMRYEVHCVLHSEAVFSLAVLNDKTILSSGRDGQVVCTNLTQRISAPIIQRNSPIFNMTWSDVTNRLFLCTSRPTVEVFADDTIWRGTRFPSGLLPLRMNSMDSSTASPSKVVLETSMNGDDDISEDIEDISSIECALEPIGGRKFARRNLRKVDHPSPKAEEIWCTPLANPRVSDEEFPDFPDMQLSGSEVGIVRHTVLNDKRHVIASTVKGALQLWDIVEGKQVTDSGIAECKSLKDAVRLLNARVAFVNSWCRVDCAWGGLRVTISHDEAFNAVVSEWEFANSASLPNPTNGSVATLSRDQRLERRRTRVNLGLTALNALQKQNSTILVLSALVKGKGPYLPLSIKTTIREETLATDQRLPTWVNTALTQGAPSSRNSVSQGQLTVELTPLLEGSGVEKSTSPTSPPTKPITLHMPKARSITHVAQELATMLSLTGPRVGELAPPRPFEVDLAAVAIPEEFIQFFVISDPFATADDGDGDDDCGVSKFGSPRVDIPSSPTSAGKVARKVERYVDPLLTIVTAFYTFKAKGSGVLQLKYKILKPDNTLL